MTPDEIHQAIIQIEDRLKQLNIYNEDHAAEIQELTFYRDLHENQLTNLRGEYE